MKKKTRKKIEFREEAVTISKKSRKDAT